MTLETGGKSFDQPKRDNFEQKETIRKVVVNKDKVRERSKRQREANNKSEDVIWTNDDHELGKWEIPDEKRVRDQAMKKGLDCRAIGGVDATSFNADKVDQDMILKMADWADKFANLFVDGKIVSNFGTLNYVKTQGDMLNIIGEIAEVSLKVKQKRFDLKDFKDKIESKYGREMLYGPQGAFNILLAIHRADEAIKGKDVGKYIYDIRVGKKKLCQAERFSELTQSRLGKGPGEASIVDAKEMHGKGSGESFDSLQKMKSEYENTYGAKVEFKTSNGEKGDVLFTLNVESAEGISRKFYLRVVRRGADVSFSLAKVPMLRGEVCKSSAEAVAALDGRIKDFLGKSKQGKEEEDKRQKRSEEDVEHVSQAAFLGNIDAFFSGDYIKEFYSEAVVSTKANGNYAGGVEIKGAKCALHIGKDTYFVFVDLASRSVEFKTVEEVETNKFGVVTLGELKAGDLKTDTDKKNFALTVSKLIRDVKKGDFNRRV